MLSILRSSLGKTEGSICLVCNKVFTAQMDIPKLSHTVVIDSAVSPTCSKTGLTEGSHCSSCDAILTSQKEISPKGHTLVNRTCSICGFVQISEGLKYVTYGNGVAVSGIGTCTDTEIIIPNIYDGKTVLGISDFAFRDNTQITKITFPNTLTFIGKFAFDGCSSIKSITIPDTVTSIGSYAFSDCNQLEEITLPFVGNSATGEGATSNYDKNFGFIFGSGANEYVPDSLKKVTITKGRIASSSFRGCSSIETIILPEGLQEIGERTFQSCTSLVNIVIPNSVTYIGDYAFSGCNKLQTITIPSNILDIGTWAFNACGALETIYFEATSMNDLDSEKSIFHSAGKSGNGIKVIVASNVTKIPNYLFYSSYTPEAPNLKSVEFEENSVCYVIGDYAFAYCTNLSYVVLPNTLTDIGVRAFYGSENLKEIIIPISVARISEYAFNWYKGPTIYCEAASKPTGWDDLWADYNFGDTIIWGYTE